MFAWEDMPTMPLWELARKTDGTIDLMHYREIKEKMRLVQQMTLRPWSDIKPD